MRSPRRHSRRAKRDRAGGLPATMRVARAVAVGAAAAIVVAIIGPWVMSQAVSGISHLRHALLSSVFGTLIIATTVNLVAGLGK